MSSSFAARVDGGNIHPGVDGPAGSFAARPGKSCQNTLLGKWLMHNGFNIRQIAAIRADGDFTRQSGYAKAG